MDRPQVLRPFATLAVAAFVATLVLSLNTAPADEGWPQFRGPLQNGWAAKQDPPTEWSESKNIRWKTAIPGAGLSSPVILDGQIWLTTATNDGRSLRAICIDQTSGKILHDVEVFSESSVEPKNAFNSYASPTPFLEKGRVYLSFGTYGNACLDAETAQAIWKNTDLRLNHMEGPGSSPVVYNSYYFLDCDGTDVQFLAALDKLTGRVAFKVPRTFPLPTLRVDQRKAFCIPTIADVNGKPELIDIGSHCAYGYDPTNGKELWHVNLPGWSNAPRPVFGEGLAFVSTGYMTAELWAIRPEAGPDGVAPVVWKWTRNAPLKPSVLLVDNKLYFISDNGIARCLDAASGRQIWQGRILGDCSASPVYAGGMIYFFDEHGKCAVLRPGNKLEVVAENSIDGRVLASPAVVDNALFVRSDSSLYRIDSKK